jgi:NADPH-dependent glutamate synthase beta subunit-like oxidoreductase
MYSSSVMYRIAIVGGGPSGIYTAKYLVDNAKKIQIYVDVFEKLPVPFGLVRYGVAPDHQEAKNVSKNLEDILQMRGVRFFGNMELGKDFKYSDLAKKYSAVVIASGISDCPV